jgi:uncharacterized protein (DUF2141 family)
MNFRKHLHWFLYPLFALACARQTTPTGGPKDTIPPSLVSSTPAKGQINYKGKKLELTFDEAIAANNPKEKIIITPDIQKKYDITARKNKVILEFENELADSTTYSINFRDAVQDITEKNPAINLKVAFSTGNYIDSLSIEGIATDPLRAKDIKDATIALYQPDTFNIFKHKPVYLTQTDQKGNFKIENLKPGMYYLYGIEDKNRNLLADSKNESYAFLSTPFDLKSNQSKISLSFIRLDARPLKLISARPYNTYYTIKTSKNLEQYKLTAETDDVIISSYAEDQSVIKVYNTLDGQDSLLVRFHARDSINNSLDTTLYIKFSKREVKPEAFTAKSQDFKVSANKGLLSGKIRFTKPVLNVNYDSIFYQVDSLNTVKFTKEDLHWDSLQNLLIIQKKLDKSLLTRPESENPFGSPTPSAPKPAANKGQPKYQFVLGKSAFVSIELDSSQAIQETLKPIHFDETGVLLVSIETAEENFIVQLLDNNFNVLQSERNKKNVSFEDLTPAEYQLRLVIDKNRDGRWSAGNFLTRAEPEPTRFYRNDQKTTSIKLKANFEIGPLLIKY